ncbi:MAG: hypothetical protein ACJAYG_001170, partial [Oceanicoccus sp.]
LSSALNNLSLTTSSQRLERHLSNGSGSSSSQQDHLDDASQFAHDFSELLNNSKAEPMHEPPIPEVSIGLLYPANQQLVLKLLLTQAPKNKRKQKEQR